MTYEVGAIVIRDSYNNIIADSDMALKSLDGLLQRILALYSAYTPLHYVILFLHGRQG